MHARADDGCPCRPTAFGKLHARLYRILFIPFQRIFRVVVYLRVVVASHLRRRRRKGGRALKAELPDLSFYSRNEMTQRATS